MGHSRSVFSKREDVSKNMDKGVPGSLGNLSS